MSSATIEILLDETGSDTIAAAIRQGVIAYNRPFFGSQRLAPFSLYIKNAEGRVVAGVNGQIAVDNKMTFVNWMWVHEELRGSGLGTQLFAEVEEYAKRKGCLAILLDTWDFQARAFYEKLGFECVGTIPKWIEGRDNHYMRKSLIRNTDSTTNSD